MRSTLSLTLLALTLGCSTSQNLGHSQSGIEAYIGEWDGYIENYQLPSGSDTIKIVIESSDGVQLTGKVLFGDAPELALPTDPNVGYPPGVDFLNAFPDTLNPVPVEGFPYTPLEVELTTERLHFTLSTREAWTAWADLQSPTPNPGCLAAKIDPAVGPTGPWVTQTSTGCVLCADPACASSTPIDCGPAWLCRSAPVSCLNPPWMMSCTTNGCTLPIGQDINLSLDMAVTGNVANGSIVRSCGESCDTCTPSGTSNLRLTRTR